MTTEEKWAERIRAWKTSGLTARVFCADKDFTAGTLQYYASRLGLSGRGGLRLARVVRKATPVLQVTVEPSDTPLVIEAGAFRVSVRRGVDRELLRDVLSALGGAP